MADDIAIKVKNVSKDFLLPHESVNSIKGAFTSILKSGALKSKKTQHALQDVSFEIKRGEFFGIVGRNGSGKSTLLKILAGIYQPTDGDIAVHGKLVPFIELGVGFNPELTGRQNVYLNGALLGFSKPEIDVQYDDIVAFAELKPFMDQKLKNYSSGMQVRLAFSMAVRAKADILLIDEVLAVGDADFQRKCFDYFNQLRKQRMTVVLVSHNMDAVREYCDRAMLIENSKVVGIGRTDVITEKYLQLFTENRSAHVSNAFGQENRWGDQAARITDIQVSVQNNKIVIIQTITATQSIEQPIAGFRIRDGAGNDITGTNTKVEKQRIPNLTKGQKITLEWKVPNILRDGKYSIDPAVLHADEVTVADWWNDAVYFTVTKNRHLPYSIDPGFELSLKTSHD